MASTVTNGFRYKGKRGARISVSPKEERTYNGRVYASKAEMEYAANLDVAQRGGNVLWYLNQVSFELGNHLHKYRADFVVCERMKEDFDVRTMLKVYAVDVKGMETEKFRQHRKAWEVFGRMPLHIVKGKTVEIVNPGMQHNQILQ